MFNSDIGLIKLPSPVKFSDVIKSIPLACSSTSGLDVIAIGNGITKNTARSIPPILQFTHLRTVAKFDCLGEFPFLIFQTNVICAEGNGKNSVCRGDSGGPLASAKTGSLVGVASFVSVEGCEEGLPQGFVRVSSYLNWIKKVTGIGCKN